MDKAIQVSGLSKQYFIGRSQRQSQQSLREWLAARVRRGRHDAREEAIWALKDVSFEIEAGEIVGVIGRNGSGKSTLLKILSRITEPTEGRVVLNGRTGSLLEVGTGFHPELTGRENIYLSGAILGMERDEIARKFAEIVEFSGVERFIDTPVKRYSSGMTVRLGFAVAAHLEPEILLVDEVLAVGDASFRKKSMGKIDNVSREGRSVLFVSHNMAAIKSLCRKAIWLDEGKLVHFGEVESVVDAYESSVYSHTSEAERKGLLPVYNRGEGIGITEISVEGPLEHDKGDLLKVTIEIEALRSVQRIGVGILIRTVWGELVASAFPGMTNHVIADLEGRQRCVFWAQDVSQFIAGGDYVLEVWLARPGIERILTIEEAALFSLPSKDIYGHGIAYESRRRGIVPLTMEFEVLRDAGA